MEYSSPELTISFSLAPHIMVWNTGDASILAFTFAFFSDCSTESKLIVNYIELIELHVIELHVKEILVDFVD